MKVHLPSLPGSVSCDGSFSLPPCAESPFARNRCYLLWHNALHHVRRHYPLPSSLIRAHAPDQIPPNASSSPSAVGSLQVVASPCWGMALPNIISAILVKSLGPIPRHVSWMHLPISSPRTSASQNGKEVRHVGISLQCNNDRGVVSRLQSFVYLQASSLARPPGCIYRSIPADARQPGRLHHA